MVKYALIKSGIQTDCHSNSFNYLLKVIRPESVIEPRLYKKLSLSVKVSFKLKLQGGNLIKITHFWLKVQGKEEDLSLFLIQYWNYTCDGEYTTVYTDIELQSCISETYIML